MRLVLCLAAFAGLLSGCEPARFATGVTAYGLERYEVPADVAALVGLVNDNKWWANPPLNLAPASANYYRRQDTRPAIVYWSEGVRTRELWVDGNKLVTKIGSRTVEHEMTLGEEAVVTRILRRGTAETGL